MSDSAKKCRTPRAHRPGRTRRITIAYDHDEYTAITAAARAAGLTPTGYTAEAALAAATSTAPPMAQPLREALLELIAARTQVRRFGINVNQAVRELNTTGEPPEWLANAVALTNRAVTRLDQATTRIAHSLH
jgi:hypothetical protein